MARLLYLLRFFRVVPPVPPLMVTTFVVTTGVIVLLMAVERERAGAAALMPLLLLQAFAAASSFDGPCRRGYYDLLLTRGEARATIAAVHWAASVLPGVLACLLVAGVERLFVAPSDAVGFTTGTALALLLVSTLPWAATVALPRFAGAVGWLLIIALSSASIPSLRPGVADARLGGAGPLVEMLALIANPAALAGREVGGTPAIWLPALLLPSLAMTTALAWLHRRDVPLEAAQ